MNIPFDVSYHFDENLHDVPNAPVQMQQAIKYLQSQFDNNSHDLYQQIKIAGLIGVYARMLHDFKTAKQALTTALKLCDSHGDKRLKIVNSIRLSCFIAILPKRSPYKDLNTERYQEKDILVM